VAIWVGMVGCASRTVHIKDLVSEPGDYDGHKVRVAGEVTEEKNVLSFGAYEIDDGTGQIWILTDRGTPDEGSRVDVEGEFQAESLIGSDKVMAIEEEERVLK
jgi:hypothetical protein